MTDWPSDKVKRYSGVWEGAVVSYRGTGIGGSSSDRVKSDSQSLTSHSLLTHNFRQCLLPTNNTSKFNVDVDFIYSLFYNVSLFTIEQNEVVLPSV